GRAGDSAVTGMWISIGVIWIWFSYCFLRFQTGDQVGVSLKLNENCGVNKEIDGEKSTPGSKTLKL
ncbi:hypothetical protein MKX03_031264, partial [Papaver bracteatum]